MTFVRKLSDAVYSIEKILGIIMMLFMVTSLMLGVVFRYFLNSPLSWSDEFGMFALVWVTYIGGSMSLKTKKAAVVSFVMERFPDGVRRFLFAIACFIALVFCIFVLSIALKWITNPTVLLQKSPAVGLPMVIPYVGIPLGMLFMSIHSLDLFVSVLQKQNREGI